MMNNAYDGEEESRGTYINFISNALKGNESIGTPGIYHDWNMLTGESRTKNNPPWPTMSDLLNAALDHAYRVGYTDNEEGGGQLLAFLRNKISSLDIGRTGRFLKGHPMAVEELLSRNTIIDTEGCDDLLVATVLLRLNETLQVLAKNRVKGGQVPLHHVIVIEEAHRFFKQLEKHQGLADTLSNMVAELGAQGIGLAFVDQSPGKVDKSVVKETAMKIAFNLETDEDRAVMKLPEGPERSYIGKLNTGETIVTMRGMKGNPLRVQMFDPTGRPRDKNVIHSPSLLIDRKRIPKPEELNEILVEHDAEFFLSNTNEGNQLTAVAEFAVMSQLLLNDRTVGFSEALIDYLVDYLARGEMKLHPKVIQTAIDKAVSDAVKSRRAEITKTMDLNQLTSYVATRLKRNFMRDEQQDPERQDLHLNRNRQDKSQIFNIFRSPNSSGFAAIDQLVIRQLKHMQSMDQIGRGEMGSLGYMIEQGLEERWWAGFDAVFDTALAMDAQTRKYFREKVKGIVDLYTTERTEKKAREAGGSGEPAEGHLERQDGEPAEVGGTEE
jgi:hypothetical protein